MANSAVRTRVHHRVIGVRDLTESTYVLRFERMDMEFQPGQYISLGPRGDINMREYSIYSSVHDDFLEILVKEVENGHISRKLRRLRPDDELYVEGPFGYFLIDEDRRQKPVYFIGTGTGLSPFHCFVSSYRDLDYRLLHGVRQEADRFELESYDSGRVVRCVSREEGGDFHGRVTEYIRQNPVEPGSSVYLCGNCDMIYEAYDILSDQGVARDSMFAEVYF